MSMGHWWKDTGRGKNEVLGENRVPRVPLCALEIKNGLTWDRTRASAVTFRRLTNLKRRGYVSGTQTGTASPFQRIHFNLATATGTGR